MLGIGLGSTSPAAAVKAAPGFQLDFLALIALVRGGPAPYSGDPNGLLTYTSPSQKYVCDAAGLLVPGTTLRCDHHPTTHAKLGLRIEGQRTNLAVRSETLASPWNQGNTTNIDSGVPSPIQGVNYRRLQATTATNTNVSLPISGAASAAGNVFSVFVRKGSGASDGNKFFLRNVTTAVNLRAATINYDTGVVTHGVGVEGVSASAQPMADGGYRLQIVLPAGFPGVTPGNQLQGYVCFPGDVEAAGEYALAVGAQMEAGVVPSSYIKTEDAQITRAADDITLPLNKFPWRDGSGEMWLNGNAVTPVVDGSDLDIAAMCFVAGVTHLQTLTWVPA